MKYLSRFQTDCFLAFGQPMTDEEEICYLWITQTCTEIIVPIADTLKYIYIFKYSTKKKIPDLPKTKFKTIPVLLSPCETNII